MRNINLVSPIEYNPTEGTLEDHLSQLIDKDTFKLPSDGEFYLWCDSQDDEWYALGTMDSFGQMHKLCDLTEDNARHLLGYEIMDRLECNDEEVLCIHIRASII